MVIENGLIGWLITIDMCKAFDLLDFKILLCKLKLYGCSDLTVKWFKSYLMGRTQNVIFNGVNSKGHPVQYGIPQGSILGPLLFVVYINDLACHLENVSISMYADDTTICTFAKSLNILQDVLSTAMSNVSTWCDNNHHLINLKKTNYMLVCSRQKMSHLKCFSLKINLYGEYIKMKSDVKVLGITIDEHLSWSCHIDRVCTKISQLIGVLFRMRHFLDFKTMFMFYNSYILPQIDYGINMWGNSAACFIKIYKYYKIMLHVSYLMLTGIPLVMFY